VVTTAKASAQRATPHTNRKRLAGPPGSLM